MPIIIGRHAAYAQYLADNPAPAEGEDPTPPPPFSFTPPDPFDKNFLQKLVTAETYHYITTVRTACDKDL